MTDSVSAKVSPNKAIDSAIKKLMAECEGKITPEQESGLKAKVEVLKLAVGWEKVKYNIKDKDAEGTQWGAPD